MCLACSNRQPPINVVFAEKRVNIFSSLQAFASELLENLGEIFGIANIGLTHSYSLIKGSV